MQGLALHMISFEIKEAIDRHIDFTGICAVSLNAY
jgi:hypothetical protein